MQIHQQIPKLPQQGERARGAVHKLLARAASGYRALDDQRPFLAGLGAAFLEHAMHTRVFGDLKKSLHRAGISTRADERLLGALAEQQFHRAEDDGFSSTGFAGDCDKARRRLPEEVFHEGKIADA